MTPVSGPWLHSERGGSSCSLRLRCSKEPSVIERTAQRGGTEGARAGRVYGRQMKTQEIAKSDSEMSRDEYRRPRRHR